MGRARSPAEAGLLVGMSPYPKGAPPIAGHTHPYMSVTPEMPHETCRNWKSCGIERLTDIGW